MDEGKPRSPWYYVPSLYFAESVPYIIINNVSVILYKKMGFDNGRIAFWTSLLYLPWVIKMFWGPLVDTKSTKRNWILGTQAAMMVCLALIATSLFSTSPGSTDFFFFSLLLFTLGAFVSATHDIATDGFYLMALPKDAQAFFVGIRTLFYRAGWIFGSGFLVWLAGYLEVKLNVIATAWGYALAMSGVVFLFLFVYHRLILPFPPEDGQRSTGDGLPSASFWEILASYFRQEKIGATLAFILLYRLGEAMLVKLAAPFLLDSHANGGLELTTAQVGQVYGTVGVMFLIFGGILGGWVISRYGLRRCLWPMAITLNVPHLAYLYMAYAQPPVSFAFPLVAIEQFGYGFGFTAYTVFLMYLAQGEYKTAHFAISTGIMALGMMLPGFVSGYIQTLLGYTNFFLLVLIMGIPGLFTLFFIPQVEENAKTQSQGH